MSHSASRLRVDQDLCVGHNCCIALASKLFELDDQGNAHEVGDGVVPPELLKSAQDAVLSCPETAITIEETDAGNA